MATDREVMQQALADLEYFAQQGYDCSASLTALRAALAEPEPEPVAFNTCPTCQSLARAVMLDQTGRA